VSAFATRPSAWTIAAGRMLVFVMAVGLWEGSVRLGWVNPFWVSSPFRIGATLWEVTANGTIFDHAWASFMETIVGFVVGSVLGILIGFALARWPTAEEILDPYLTALNSLPRVALAPLFILWFGIGEVSKILVAVTLVVFILIINTLAGARGVDQDIQTVARLLGATQRQLFFKVILPASAPTIFAGLRLGMVYSLLGAVVAEMLSSTRGIGHLLSFYAGTYNVTGVMAMLLLLSLFATALNEGMRIIERRSLRWTNVRI
jgi:NitT/TauT family transport system permease protein